MFLHPCAMKKKETFAKVIKVLSCLVVAFALVFFPPTSAHAATGLHGGHSVMVQGEASSLKDAHTHSAAQTDCGSKKSDTSTPNTGAHQCCAGMCLAAILIEVFASPQADASGVDVAIPHALPVAAVSHGFLRPPKHLI